MKEKDLNIYDVWESSNGNVFIKLTEQFSIAIGPLHNHGPNQFDIHSQYIKQGKVTPVKKIGKIIIDGC